MAFWSVSAAFAQTTDLTQLSLSELANLEVTSVSKSAEPLQRAPAAIYVITHDDIMRSGATSVAEALRLAPNLQVTQLSASNYVAAARGFGGNPPDQSFSNQLLILIDGRSVYSPLFSGVYLDAQDLMLEDVDRIEVISGPGATLWGANAVNGVINIITRAAYLTQGALVSADAGNLEQDLSARYGAKTEDDTAFRIYAKTFRRDSLEEPDGSSAKDDWYRYQGGFRLDHSQDSSTLTVQGDLYRALENHSGDGYGMLSGANVLGRWTYRSERSEIQLQGYYDQTESFAPAGGTAFVLHTFDLQLQQSLSVGTRNQIVWGAGERVNSYEITNTPTFIFDPARRAPTLANIFAQDTVSIGSAVKVIGGIKFEDDPYAGWQVQPDARLSWSLSPTEQLWAAASRAVRSPTPFDVDVIEKLGTTPYLTGNREFQPTRVSAYEAGYRGHPAEALSLSVSAFYNVYDNLRSVEPASSEQFIPLHWGNGIAGHTSGIEAWAQWQLSSWWRLSPGVRTVHESLAFKPGASGLLGLPQAGDDPSSEASLTSSMDLGSRLSLDATLRHAGPLPDPALPAYTEVSARLGWRVSANLQLALTGSNLLHARHLEFPAPYGEEIPRSFMVQAQWKP